jgi:hypothetical protein
MAAAGPGVSVMRQTMDGQAGAAQSADAAVDGPLEAAETLGVNPDTFGLDRPGYQGWDRLEL